MRGTTAGVRLQAGPTIARAFASGKPSVVNVVADPYAKAKTQAFGSYSSRLD